MLIIFSILLMFFIDYYNQKLVTFNTIFARNISVHTRSNAWKLLINEKFMFTNYRNILAGFNADLNKFYNFFIRIQSFILAI